MELTQQELIQKIEDCLETAVENLSDDLDNETVVSDMLSVSLDLLKRVEQARRLATEVMA
jgi:hypothetical protein